MYLKREMMEDTLSPKSRGHKNQRVMSSNFWTTLQIAYYNMGVEEEFLGKLQDALTSLEKAKKISELHLKNPNSAMTLIIEKNISEISQKKALRDRIHASRRQYRQETNLAFVPQKSKISNYDNQMSMRRKSRTRNQN